MFLLLLFWIIYFLVFNKPIIISGICIIDYYTSNEFSQSDWSIWGQHDVIVPVLDKKNITLMPFLISELSCAVNVNTAKHCLKILINNTL